MEIKGVSILEWWLTKWLHEHGFPLVKARVAADFQYDNDEQTIYFALAVTDEQDWKFLKFCQEVCGFPYECDNFILSFFHELGHYVTWYEWDEEEWDDYEAAKMILLSLNANIEDYFDLPIERFATDWGCTYIREHEAEINEWWRMVHKLIMNIYKQNNVEVEE